MGFGWIKFPAEGLSISFTLRFPSYQEKLAEANEVVVDVDSVLTAVDESFHVGEDTLNYYRNFFSENPSRIYLPGDDYTFFDTLFVRMEHADSAGIVRVIHYGDSQIEMDRISQDLRDSLQSRFGGIGTGMFPALANVPSASISRYSSGSFIHYTMYGDSTTRRAGHSRYGIMAQFVRMGGGGTISIRSTDSKTAKERTKTFQTVSMLYGRPDARFSAKAISDTLRPTPTVVEGETATLVRWDFGRPVDKARIVLTGSAEIYGLTADGANGVAVDNIPLRGCSGTIFSGISKPLMAESLQLENAGLIILQFGGNYIPVSRSSEIIGRYCKMIAGQIQYFHTAAPDAKILFIGPSDMGTSRAGRIVTRPRLVEMVDSLKATALRNDAAYWDLFRMMGGENSMREWVKHSPPYAGADYTHFTPLGAQKVGEALSRSFLTYYDFYLLRKTAPEEDIELVFAQ